MKMLHDPVVQSELEVRLDSIRIDSTRQWGKMTVDQMLWHVNQFLAASLGDGTLPVQQQKIPLPIMRFFLLYMPWPKGAPTNRGAVPKERYDLEVERKRCRALISRFVSKPIDEPWPNDPSFGPATGKNASRLQAKHLDHHFRQFGA